MVTDGDGKGWLYPPDGGARIPMTIPDGEVIAPGAGATWFLSRPGPDRTIFIDRADLRRGTRAPVATIALPEGTGLADFIITSVVGETGRYGYVYCYTLQLSTLVVASGVIGRWTRAHSVLPRLIFTIYLCPGTAKMRAVSARTARNVRRSATRAIDDLGRRAGLRRGHHLSEGVDGPSHLQMAQT
jgi:hypothetical protein